MIIDTGVSNRAKWRPRFQDLKISLGSQDFYGILIYGFLWISGFLWELWEFYGIISVFYGNNRKNIAFGISDLGFQARFQHLRPRFQLVADPSHRYVYDVIDSIESAGGTYCKRFGEYNHR